MKKKILLILFTFIIFPISVFADKIYNIDMEIHIDELGNANITEKWDVKADSGSEWYKQLLNMGNQEVSNFTVSMDDTPLEYKSWNIKESISQKSGYYGINRVSEGIELCFGKSDFKRHNFTLNYTLSNIIINTSDSQVLYETLFPHVTMDNFTVEISSYYSFPDTLDVWGYGYKGYAYVKDGKIKMSNIGRLNNDYIVLLAKFPLNTFNTSNYDLRFNKFNDVYNMAEEGTYKYDYNQKSNDEKLNIIKYIAPLIILIPVIIICIKYYKKTDNYYFKDNKVIDKRNIPLFRDIPCNKDIYYANALIKLNGFGFEETNIFGAIILKWVKNKKIGFQTIPTGVNSETRTIDLTLNPTFDNPLEQELFNVMYEASGEGILEIREFEKWAYKHSSKFFTMFDKIKNNAINDLKKNNHISSNIMDDMLYEDSIKLYGLKKYLEEFSNMDTKEVMDVHLWDEYLMFAYLFGIADKVAKQLKNMYPETIKEMSSRGFDFDTLLFIDNISTSSFISAYTREIDKQSKEERLRDKDARNYSGGGGGFSSGGGGSGSFGGGGSMGGR